MKGKQTVKDWTHWYFNTSICLRSFFACSRS